MHIFLSDLKGRKYIVNIYFFKNLIVISQCDFVINLSAVCNKFVSFLQLLDYFWTEVQKGSNNINMLWLLSEQKITEDGRIDRKKTAFSEPV